MKRITLLGDINAITSYGLHGIQLVRDLERLAGVWAGVRCATRWEPGWGDKLPDDIKRKIVSGPQPEPWEILLHSPNFVPTPNRKTVYFSMHESTKLPPMGPHLLNKAEVVVVPCAWNASCFSACGVTRPIRVVPLGIKPEVFHQRPMPSTHPKLCVFGAAGNQGTGVQRKGLTRVVRLFQEAFPDEPQVRLKIKALPDRPVPAVADKRIEICNRWMDEPDLADWFGSLTCFVSLACGEGWGLMQQQAMATGRPLVAPCFGGLAEFFQPGTGWPIPYRLVAADAPYEGHWAWSDDRAVIAVLRAVAADPGEAQRRGQQAAVVAGEFTWERSVREFVQVLHEVGALSGDTIQVAGSGSKFGVMAYLPPEGIGHTDVFRENLREHPPKSPLVYLTDSHWPGVRIAAPRGRNSDEIACEVFSQAIQYARGLGWQHMIWLETDCRVKGPAWDERLVAGMKPDTVAAGNLAWCGRPPPRTKSSGPGRVLRHGAVGSLPVPFVNGAPACYHVERTAALLEWLGGAYRIQDRPLGEELVRRQGSKAARSFVHLPEVMATAGERLYPPSELRQQLESGQAVAVHPIKNRWRPTPPGGHIFYHSGDLGDIVYALKAMALSGKGELHLGNDCAWIAPRQPLTAETCTRLRPLLEQQPCVSAARFEQTRAAATVDFNLCRKLWHDLSYRQRENIHNLCQMYCHVAGVEFDAAPWLRAERKRVSRVVFNRSARWRDEFPWRDAVSKYGREAIFVGLPEEHQEFSKEFGYVPYYPVTDFGELAAVIHGAELFVGNQSFPCALALGLGVAVWQETCRATPDCLFLRPNFFNQSQPPDLGMRTIKP